MLEKTLVLIKPSGFQYKDRIMDALGEIGRVVYSKSYEEVPIERLAQHYKEHRGTELYEWLISSLGGKPIEALVLEGYDVVSKTRNLVGHSDPQQAKEGTIRSWGEDNIELADLENRPIENLVHCPSDRESARRELSIWI